MKGQRMVTARELAELLQVSVETIWRYTRLKQIPYIELGKRQYRYMPEKVLQAINAQANEAPAEIVRESSPVYATDKVYTYEDYLEIPDDGVHHYEILDGMLIREPAPNVHHQRISRRLQHVLINYFSEHDPEGEVFDAPIDVTLSNTNVVQPDLIYIPGSVADIIERTRINGSPYLAVEILTPSSGAKDRVRKLNIYHRLGIIHYWIVDPEQETIEAYVHQPEGYCLRCSACADMPFDHPDFPGLQVNTAALWKPRGA